MKATKWFLIALLMIGVAAGTSACKTQQKGSLGCGCPDKKRAPF
jgi:hypothetical protein